MTRKKPEKRIIFLEPDFSDILVCQKKEFRPYLETIFQDGENITHQGLGTLLGVFEITDESEDSSYIVNFILSVIKKEYFSKGKRGPIESFESALHKANLALSKLAQHENINWIGKFNAIVAVIEKNNLHFSQTGRSSALLLRNGFLTNLSEGMNEEEDPNPLKTFTNLSSGKLEKNDKLILVTPEIFEIFSLEEIKKAALRFSQEDFIQFLRTALGNELKKTAVLVIDMKEKEELSKKPATKKENLNAFSQKAFIPKSRSQEEKKDILQKFEEAMEKDIPEKAKHGHIYIREELEIPLNENGTAKKIKIEKILNNFLEKARKGSSGKKIKELAGQIRPGIKKIRLGAKIKKGLLLAIDGVYSLAGLLFSRIKSFKFPQKKTRPLGQEIPNSETPIKRKDILPALKRIIPNFSNITKKLKFLTPRQKIYAIIALFLIFVVPIFIAKSLNAPKENKQDTESQNVEENIIEETSNSNQTSDFIQFKNTSDTFLQNGIQGIIRLNDAFFAIKKDSVTQIPENKSWPVPQDFGEISQFSAMNDLNIIFIINKDNRILSFSPTSQKFQENKFSLPENSQIISTGTFMTYLYVLDHNNNQIYRYPRAEGGFGEKTNWLKENADLNSFNHMAVTDNIYLWNKNTLAKYLRGRKEDLALEGSPAFDYFYADENYLYTINKAEGSLKKFSLDGKLISQFFSDKIKTADSFAASSDGKIFHLASSETITSLYAE